MSGIVDLERRAMRAIPPVESVSLDGWLLPFGRGRVRRMNAVTTFGIVPWEPFEAVETVERRYRARRRPVMFRLTDLDSDLDDLLFSRGYRRTAEVAVLTGPAQGGPDPGVAVTGAVTPGWIDLLERLGGYDEARVAELGESLSALTLEHGAFRLDSEAVGLAVVDTGWVGLFDIAVAEDRRRRGLGGRISRSMLAWGAGQGASSAYLQVMTDNKPAVALYESLGFTETYRYWYRLRQ